MRTDDAVPVDFPKKEDGRSQLRLGFLFWVLPLLRQQPISNPFLFLGPAASKIVTCSLFSLTMRERGA